MKTAEHASEIDDRADISAVKSAAGERCGADGTGEIRTRSRRERGDHRLAVTVIKDEIFGVFRQAGALFFERLGEAGFIDANAERAREQHRMLFQRFRVGVVDRFHVGEIFFETRSIETRLIQILRSANENARASADGAAQRTEIATGFGREENQRLLSVLRNGDDDSLFLNRLGPRFCFREPILRRRVCRSAQKRDDQQVARGLIVGKIGMQPQAIAGLQIRDLRDRQRLAVARDLHLDARAEQIETVVVGASSRRQAREAMLPRPRGVSRHARHRFERRVSCLGSGLRCLGTQVVPKTMLQLLLGCVKEESSRL